MRRICDPDYEYAPWGDERRARASALHRKRWGAPDGYATVRGIHVPLEHRAPIRLWSDWIAYHDGEEAARCFIQGLRNNEWRDMPQLHRLYQDRKEVAALRREIRNIAWEAYRGNSDHS